MAKGKRILNDVIPDGHPFKTGVIVFGMKRPGSSGKPSIEENKKAPASSTNPELDELNQQIEDWATKGIYEAAAHQMSTDYPSEKTDESPSSTSANEKDDETPSV